MKKLIIAVVVWIFTLKKGLSDFIAIHLFRRHKKTLKLYPGKQTGMNHLGRVAIVAIYPTKKKLLFVQNLLRALADNGFYTLVVSNIKLSQMHCEMIEPYCGQLIQRCNVGRDIGAYQYGINLLKKQNLLKQANWLILANDSVFYPQGITQVLSEMLERGDSWQSLFQNFQHHYHAQSFFLLFSKEVFETKIFNKYWQNYFPSSIKRYAVNKGEVGLSAVLKKAGFSPKGFYTSSRIIKEAERQLGFSPSSTSEEFLQFIYDVYDLSAIDFWRPQQSEKEAGASHYATESDGVSIVDKPPHLPHLKGEELNPEHQLKDYVFKMWRIKLFKFIDESIHKENPTHTSGLLASYLVQAPLKKDIFYHQFCGVNQVLRYAKGFNPEELELIESELLRKDYHAKQLLTLKGKINSILTIHGLN